MYQLDISNMLTIFLYCNAEKSNEISQLQPTLDSIENWSTLNNMTLNPSKCFTLHVTFMKNPPQPEDLFINRSKLCNVDDAKILGVIVQSNLKWNLHIEQLVKRCNRKIYMLRKIKKYHLPVKDLVLIYTGYIRPILEYCAPVFHSGLTIEQSSNIERIQKRVCKIILGHLYISYPNACQQCNLLTLEERRLALCRSFAKSLPNNPTCQNWLPPRKHVDISLRHTSTFHQYKFRTKRFQNSPLPFLVNLLNQC